MHIELIFVKLPCEILMIEHTVSRSFLSTDLIYVICMDPSKDEPFATLTGPQTWGYHGVVIRSSCTQPWFQICFVIILMLL